MAQRRMFSLKIIDTDSFLDMSISARLLYYDLSMRADDDGFVSSPKKIQRMVGASDDDLKILIAKEFIFPFESGVCVIKDWKIHNYIQKDRYTATFYKLEKSMLEEDSNGSYEFKKNSMDTKCIQNESKMYPQVRLGKARKEIEIGKKESKKVVNKKTGYDEIILKYTSNKELSNTIIEFIKMRSMIKAKMTDNALKLMLNKLSKMTNDDFKKIKILEQSIMNSWKGIFDLKGDNDASIRQYNKPVKKTSRWDKYTG